MNQGKTFFIHLRNKVGAQVSNVGGKTVAYRETADGGIEFALAKCSPNDNFNRAQGRAKAAGRLNSPRFLYKMANITEKDFRAAVYNGDIAVL